MEKGLFVCAHEIWLINKDVSILIQKIVMVVQFTSQKSRINPIGKKTYLTCSNFSSLCKLSSSILFLKEYWSPLFSTSFSTRSSTFPFLNANHHNNPQKKTRKKHSSLFCTHLNSHSWIKSPDFVSSSWRARCPWKMDSIQMFFWVPPPKGQLSSCHPWII